MTCTLRGLKPSFASRLGRLVLQHLRQLEHAAQIARGLARHQRREHLGLGDLHAHRVVAIFLEQVDQPERRRIMLLAHLLGGLGAHLLGEQGAHRLLQHQLLPPRRAFRAALLQHGLARGPAESVAGRHQLIDEADGLGRARAQHAPGEHRGHGVHRAGGLDRPHRAVQSGEDAELDLGKAEPRPLLAVGDAPIAGQRQLEPAAEAIAVNGGDHGHRQPVDAVDQLERLLHHLGDLGLGVEALELPDIGAGDEARLLAAHQHQALDLAFGCRVLDRLDDLAKLLGRAGGRASSCSRLGGR